MSDNEDISQVSQSTTFGTIGSLANNPLIVDPNESEQPEPKPNEIITNIIKDSSKVTSQDNSDFDNEYIQKERNSFISDLQSESIIPDDNNLLPRKSITSDHFIDNKENSSTPAIIDSSSNNLPQDPIRSMSESVLIDHHDTTELSTTLPIQQDESSTDGDDFVGVRTNNTNETPANTTKQNGFGTTSRKESASSKRSPSTSGDHKQGQLPDETGTDTDRDNREVVTISRRPSTSKSPLNQPRSPTPDDSPKTLTNVESKRPESSSYNDHKDEQKETSRPSSTIKSKFNDNLSQSSINKSNNDFLTTDEQSKLIRSGEQLRIPTNDINNEQFNSPPPSPSTKSKSRQSSHTSQQQQQGSIITDQQGSIITDQQGSIITDQQGSIITDQKEQTINNKDSRRSSTDTDGSVRTSAKQKQERILSNDKRQSSLQKRSGQQSRKNSNITTDQTVITPIKTDSAKFRQENKKRSSITDSDHEHINTSKLPRVNSSSQATTPTKENQTTHRTQQVDIPPPQTTDDEIPLSRPQSPNVEQIAERNPPSTTSKKRNIDEQKKKEQNRSLRRSNSTESSNHIPLVDDKSLDSTSGNNTESENPKQQRIKSKKKDVETNTDSKTNSRNGNYQQQQQQQQEESTSPKPSKVTKPMSDHSQSTRRRIPTREKNLTTPDSKTNSIRRSFKQSKNSNKDQDPVNVNVTVLVKNMTNQDDDETPQKPKNKQKSVKLTPDHERQTQSDTEQIITEKQKKRRRPKRISRTTQTYECVFRRMEYGNHEELRPTSNTEKNIQTRQSRLRPRTKSPKRHYPIYLSTDAFKIEEILPKHFPHTQRNMSKTSVTARSNSPQNGKLLILRPTLPFHHTDAVHVQRISLQYAIDLVPNENRPNDSKFGQRNKTHTLKQSEQTNNFPVIRSSPTPTNVSTNKSNTKDKSIPNRIEDRTYQRKDGGTV